jgi:hypothetical protein
VANCTATWPTAERIKSRQRHRDRREEPADFRVEPAQEPLGVEALEADAQDIGQRLQELLAAAFPAAPQELLALASHGGDHQPAAVQHPQELLQLVERDLLRRELGLEALLDLVHARLPVEHLEDRELLLLEAVVVQPDRVLHDPVAAAQVVVAAGAEVRPFPQRELSGGAGKKTVVEGDHR